MKKLEQKNNRDNSVFNTFRLKQQLAQIEFDELNGIENPFCPLKLNAIFFEESEKLTGQEINDD